MASFIYDNMKGMYSQFTTIENAYLTCMEMNLLFVKKYGMLWENR